MNTTNRQISIQGWLDERIEFINNFLSSTKNITDQNASTISKFSIVLENFKYCKILHTELLNDPNNADVKTRFRKIALNLIFDAIHELDKQEYKCIYLHGYAYPSTEKEILPAQIIDNISKIRIALTGIYDKVVELCGNDC